MSLKEISKQYTDKDTVHDYLDTYEAFFNKKKYQKINILEIGIREGGSIQLWRDYFENGQVYGIDISPSNEIIVKSIINDDRITLFTGVNAYDDNFVKNNVSDIKFDYMIDDGPHTLESMIYFVQQYSNLLKDDGVLIVEDVQNIEWIQHLTDKTPEYLKKYIKVYDLRKNKGRYDDILFIIDKSIE